MLSQISIQAVHYTISSATQTFIEEKLTKLDYLKGLIIDGTIRVIRDNPHYKLEADIHLKSKQRIHIHTTSEQLYPAIENLMHKLKHKLSEEHKKIKSHNAPHSASVHHSEGQASTIADLDASDDS